MRFKMWQKWKIGIRSEEKKPRGLGLSPEPDLGYPVWDGTESFYLGMKEQSGLCVQGM